MVVRDVGRRASNWRVWLVGNTTAGGEGGDVVYSVKVFRCGEDGLNECPFIGDEKSGISRAVVIAVAVVVGVVVLAIVLMIAFRIRFKKHWGASENGSRIGAAWESVSWRIRLGGISRGRSTASKGTDLKKRDESIPESIPEEGYMRTTTDNVTAYKLRLESETATTFSERPSELSSEMPTSENQ